MAESNTTVVRGGGGVSLCGLVFIVFLILKLAEIGQVAHWSWWWVTAPLWMPVCLLLGILVVILVLAIIVWIVKIFVGK